MKWILVRHGLTQGNLEGRYIGCRTDEELCDQGIAQLKALRLPPVRHVFTSPMRRCLESAKILYPDVPAEIITDFRECHFGAFENKNYEELKEREDYLRWLSSGGTLPFPGGESQASFRARCVRAFEQLKRQNFQEDCALIVHGGTIMAIMHHFARPSGNYYDFQLRNGEGYILAQDGSYEMLSFCLDNLCRPKKT